MRCMKWLQRIYLHDQGIGAGSLLLVQVMTLTQLESMLFKLEWKLPCQ